MIERKEEADARFALRMPFQTAVKLFLPEDALCITGEMRDISMFGTFVVCQARLQVGCRCALTILLKAPNSSLRIESVQAEVVRQTAEGVGLKFLSPFEWYALFSVYGCYAGK